MGILNCTPDSFSDGDIKRVESSSLDHIVNLANQLIADGADILDIGGMSTRPGVNDKDVTEDEELSRIIPVIQALRLDEINIPISVDTFRPTVAEQAILAGASCINDIRGGREPGMFELMARINVPVILMHSRGDSISMVSQEAKDYTKDQGVVNGVRRELRDVAVQAEAFGVKRWNTILDPGVGFAKSLEGNLELLKALPTLFDSQSGLDNYATLVGASRKGFIGTITGKKEPRQREFGNAAITATCCASSIDIVRVHEAAPAKDVINMLGAILNA